MPSIQFVLVGTAFVIYYYEGTKGDTNNGRREIIQVLD